MSFLTIVGDLFAGGGFTGMVSAGVGAYAKHKQLKLELEHKRKEWAYDYRMQELQNQSDRAMAEQDLLIAAEKGASSAFNAAIEAESKITNSKTHMWVNDVRALFRPTLTMVLWIMVFIVIFSGVVESKSEAVRTIVSALVQASAAATGFWFGSRAIKTQDVA